MADEQLRRFRSSIDNIDAALILLLAERFKITEDVGRHKAQQGLPAADPEREKQQIARLRELSSAANLDPTFSEAFLRLVIDEVIRRHERTADQP
ncbi:MAG: chorismate mutase [Acidimicrobiaceae bacterium]|nr:chorismate mutase [Acidimicrobiaceae bacterium]MDE0606400.1 chorismate mutase [Acidimicrobiaceae bacterium]